METQLHLTGTFARDQALDRLRGKYSAWINNVAAPLLYQFCKKNEFFTTDEIWEEFETHPSPGERRVMGAVIRGFAKKGHIVKTGVTEKSQMPQCHARDKAVWRSNLYGN